MHAGGRKRSQAGVTLVEVMLAGAMTAIAVLATIEAFTVAGKIAHENAEALRADNVATTSPSTSCGESFTATTNS